VSPSEQSPAPNDTRPIGATLESAMGGPSVHGMVHLATGIASAESAPMRGPQIDVHGSARVSEAAQPLGVVAWIVGAAPSPNTRSQRRWREIHRGNRLPTTLSVIADAVRQRFPASTPSMGRALVKYAINQVLLNGCRARPEIGSTPGRQRRCRRGDGDRTAVTSSVKQLCGPLVAPKK
jgi:hypothetical protein